MKHSPIKLTFWKGMRDYVPLFVCAVISAALWITREMGKTYEEQLSIPITYTNVPKSLVLVSEFPEKLIVTVEAPGWGILSHYLFGNDEFTIDITEIVATNYSHISTKDPMILAGLGEQLKVLDVYPAEINFSFEKVNSKVVPVKTNVSLSFMQQYELDGDITVSPDSITVYGAKKSIDTIHAVYSKPLEKNKLRNPFSDKVELIPIRNVVFSNESVEISGEVEKFTEQTISIPIKLLNVPNGQVVDLMTEKVSLTFLIGMSKVQSYYPSDFEAIVDFEKLAANGSVPIEIVRYPNFVRIIHQNPMNDGVITNYTDTND